jgi:hypothetical protein
LTDEQGNVVPHDDAGLRGDSLLVRHINPEQHLYFDENLNRTRIASSAFSATNGDPYNGMSVDLTQLLEEADRPHSAMVPSGFGAVSLRVSDVRELGLQVGSDPIAENPFHGQAWGVKTTTRKKLQRIVLDWVVPLDNAALR